MNADLIARTLDVLHRAGAEFAPGLTDDEFEQLESTFNFRFAPDHREFLARALPIRDRWMDWRTDDMRSLQRSFDWPIEGIIFDVHENAFWPGAWGERPGDACSAEEVARRELASWPTLVPLYGHRYIAAATADGASPVFSAYQSDVILYGADLYEYVLNEFRRNQFEVNQPTTRIPFWSDLAEGVEPCAN